MALVSPRAGKQDRIGEIGSIEIDWDDEAEHRRKLAEKFQLSSSVFRNLDERVDDLTTRLEVVEDFVDAYPSGGALITVDSTQDPENKLTIADLSIGSIDLQLVDVLTTWEPGEVFTYTFKQINQSGGRRLRLVPFGTQEIDGAADFTFPNTSLAALTLIPAPALSGWLIESSYRI